VSCPAYHARIARPPVGRATRTSAIGRVTGPDAPYPPPGCARKLTRMFTGIIEKTSSVIGATEGPMFRRLTLASDWDGMRLGDSVAVNGVCLTISAIQPGELSFDVIKETLDKTNLGLLEQGDE